MLVIGLTGGIASGKSIVASMLRKAKIPVIDADELARDVTTKDSEGLIEVVEAFGSTILNDDETLNRKKLRDIVFADKKALEKLEGILHPKIAKAFKKALAQYQNQGAAVIVYMAPLLFEKGLHEKLDKTLLVIAPKELRRKRMMARDGLSPEEAEKRFMVQLSDEVSRKMADIIIENTGTIDELYKKLWSAWYELTHVKLPDTF